MQKYCLAVCEDDKVVRDEICRVCDEILEQQKIAHEITVFPNAVELEQFLETKGQVFHLLILDIKMEHKTGMEFARELRERNDRTSLIFVTGYEEYLGKGYEVQPVQFLLKPLDWNALKKAVMMDWRVNHCPKTVLLEKGRRKIRLLLSSILYAETDGKHGVRIILKDEEVNFTAGMAELEQMLPDGQFIRCHNSYIVNLEHVREVSWLTFWMDNGQNLPISRKYYDRCQNAFVSYINR